MNCAKGRDHLGGITDGDAPVERGHHLGLLGAVETNVTPVPHVPHLEACAHRMCAVFNDPEFAIRSKIEDPLEVPSDESIKMLNKHGAGSRCNGRSQGFKVGTVSIQFD